MAPWVTSWQLTKANLTARSSSSFGAVSVRPTRLVAPASSMNRYQYSREGFKPAARKRQVQSVAAVTATSPRATRFRNSGSLATSTVSRCEATPARSPPRPQDHAVRTRIARGDALRKEVATFAAWSGRRLGGGLERQRRAEGRGLGGEGSPR